MKRNKLLTIFLALGMGLSLVACSSNEPETKVAEEKKIEETKAIEEKEEKVEITKKIGYNDIQIKKIPRTSYETRQEDRNQKEREE